jgi:hypothetical protein
MWATFGKYAAEHEYKPWRDFDCSEYNSPLLDIRTGPSGQLNREYLINHNVDPVMIAKGTAPTVNLDRSKKTDTSPWLRDKGIPDELLFVLY